MIRPLDHDDIDACVPLGALMHAESAFSHLPYSPIKVVAMLTRAAAGLDGLACFVGGSGIQGIVVARVSPHPYCDALWAWDMGIYVDPAARGGMLGVKLIRAYADWAKGKGADLINVGMTAGINNERTGKLLERMGFVNRGTCYEIRT